MSEPIYLHARQIGTDGPLVVMVHGLNANGNVWEPLIAAAKDWPGRFLVPDLRGHGRSFHRAPYSYAGYAADIAALCKQNEEIVVVGHSLGGTIAVALATGWFGVTVRHAIALSVKTRWSAEEINKMQALARREGRRFAGRHEALDWHLKVSGLNGLIAPESPLAANGIRRIDDSYGLAADQKIYAATGPAVEDFAGIAKAPIHWAVGTKDPMVSADDLRSVTAQPELIEGGHNVHVEQPELVWRMVRRVTGI